MSIGAKIQQLRKAAGLSQEQLADLIGISRQAVSKWETDQSTPDVDKLLLLCSTFHVSSDALLGTCVSGNPSDSCYSPVNTKLEACVKMNFQRRCFTAGWITALVGVVLLIAEYFSLFFLKNAAIKLDFETNSGLGFYNNAMEYAAVPPMPVIFGITIALIAIGGLIAVASLVFTRFMQKSKKAWCILPIRKPVSKTPPANR